LVFRMKAEYRKEPKARGNFENDTTADVGRGSPA
jgi:hypothetical protein